MYENMYKIRYYEDKMAEAYTEGKNPVFNIGAGPVPGEMHLATGQEPAAVGICVHLKKKIRLRRRTGLIIMPSPKALT